jgi:LmbE family N-acetylglucosaminyl deacetylase
MTIQATAYPDTARAVTLDLLPGAVRVLAVTARPGQESADLGGPLYLFRRSGASLSLLCLTLGETAGLGSDLTRLEAERPWEVRKAASILGIRQVSVASYRDGRLHHSRVSELAGRIQHAISKYSAELVLVVAPETGDVGDAAVARAATIAALQAGVPLAARTRPDVIGARIVALGAEAEAARAIQKSAAAAYASQSEALPGVISRLDQLGNVEALRWLVSPTRVPWQGALPRTGQEG